MKRVKAIVSGRVQGVFYRAAAREQADRLGLSGYVRNLPNGDVELVAEGEDDRVNRLVAWARIGPPMAHVDGVTVEDLEGEREFSGFRVSH
jgi:acylphosphatase